MSFIDTKLATLPESAQPLREIRARALAARAALHEKRAALLETGHLTADGIAAALQDDLDAFKQEAAALTSTLQSFAQRHAARPQAEIEADPQHDRLIAQFCALSSSARLRAIAQALGGNDMRLARALAREDVRFTGVTPANLERLRATAASNGDAAQRATFAHEDQQNSELVRAAATVAESLNETLKEMKTCASQQ